MLPAGLAVAYSAPYCFAIFGINLFGAWVKVGIKLGQTSEHFWLNAR